MKFAWSKTKAEENFAKHGISFDSAKGVFNDPYATENLDDRHDYGEGRFVIIGLVDGQFLNVVYTERNDVFRIISARKATKHERENYLEENQ